MRNVLRGWVLMGALVSLPCVAFAGTVVLKSGKTVEGKVLERTSSYVRLDCEGVPVSYFIDEIDSIDGEKVALPESAAAPVRASSAPEAAPKEPAAPQGPTAAVSVPEAPFKTAVIKYRVSGVMEGSQVVYLDLVKNKAARESWVTKTLGNFSTKDHSLDIYDGKTYTTVRVEKKEGVRQKMEGDLISIFFDEESCKKYAVSSEKFLGRDCRAYKTPMGKVYYWNRIKVREEISNHPMGKDFNYTLEATDIQMDVPVPPEAFVVPGGVKVMSEEEVGEKFAEMLRGMQSQGCPLKKR